MPNDIQMVANTCGWKHFLWDVDDVTRLEKLKMLQGLSLAPGVHVDPKQRQKSSGMSPKSLDMDLPA